MPSFCSKCGSPLTTNSAFCVQCGTPVGQGPAVPVAPATLPPAAKGSSALKIIIVLLCVLVVGGIAVVGGVFYLAHRAKQIIVQKAAEQGVDLNSITSTSPAGVGRTLPKPCDVLSKDDASRLIGEPVERMEVKDAACLYYGPAGLTAKLAHDQAQSTFQHAQTPGATVDGMQVANSVDQLVNSMAAQTGQTGYAGELPLLILGLDADGKSQMTALTTTKAIFGSLGRNADTKGIGFGADIPGLGNKAVRLPKLGLNVLKGENLIRIIPGPFPDADTKTIAIARAVLPKI